jgi:[histone H3]-lysine36 N-trimethyltransferase
VKHLVLLSAAMAKSTVGSPQTDSVDGDTIEVKREVDEQMPSEDNTTTPHRVRAIKDEAVGSRPGSPAPLPSSSKLSRSSSSSTVKSRSSSEMSSEKREADEKHEDDSFKLGPCPPKSTRPASHKPISRVPILFDDLEDATVEAKGTFSVIESCTYANKFLGYTEHAMECDCTEEWGEWDILCNSLLHINSARN